MQWFLNFIPAHHINLSDRGFAYGDGLFETIATQHGSIINLSGHQARLARGLKRLNFAVDDALLARLWSFIAEQATSNDGCGIKLILTRGSGGRGYLPPDAPQFEVIVGVFDAPDYKALKQQGVSLTISSVECSLNRSIAGLKHLNRLENVMAKQALAPEYYEALMKTATGHVIEAVQSNIFWVKDGILQTPAIIDAGVQGSFRSQVIKNFQGVVNVSRYHESDLLEADEIFVCNALSGVLPVTHFQDRAMKMGPVTQQLMEQLY
ncbi:aminodeoxychorismate lyase [Marinomonas ostreistagni]|uniref:aminodeoxychorismate lyase n=1 Tax=Marinomonas ostreistagni TaxID=359209 RepID=UPI0019517CC9|nr:aminodeoxychorismate lyase [Marinomonas ostreistagni]MBM6550289.1 aminodeoxychorismate lyase [Marinomonas ostreistagni]